MAMAEVRFLEEHNWDGYREEIFFHALPDQDSLVRCRLPSEVLQDSFGALSAERGDLDAAFRSQRTKIELIAQILVQSSRYEEDGSIPIRSQDVSAR